MSEVALWNYVHNNIGHLGHFSRIESGDTAAGIPDVEYCIGGISGHLELKSSTKLRQSQFVWMRDRLRAGGIVNVLWQDGQKKEWRLIPGDSAVNARLHMYTSKPYWIAQSRLTWKASINWEELVRFMTGKGDAV